MPADVIGDFAIDFSQFRTNNAALIGALEREIVALPSAVADRVREHLDERADDLASSLGAQAANACGEGEDDQDEAISSAESWVSDNVGNAGLGECIAAVLWLDGPQAGAALLRQAMSKG